MTLLPSRPGSKAAEMTNEAIPEPGPARERMVAEVDDVAVIAAIRWTHLRSAARTIALAAAAHWERAWVDPGFGPESGPYVKLPLTLCDGDEIVIRVRAPERLRRRLAARWTGRAKWNTLPAAATAALLQTREGM